MRKYYTNDFILTVGVLAIAISLAIFILHVNLQGKEYRDSQRINSIKKINHLIKIFNKKYHYYPNEILTSTVNSVPLILDLYSNKKNLISSYMLCKSIINPQLNLNSGENYPNCRNTSFNIPLTKNLKIKTNPSSTYYFYIPFDSKQIISYNNDSKITNYILGTCLENKSIYIKYSNKNLYRRINKFTLITGDNITISCSN